MPSWPQQKFPTVTVRGVIFGRVGVEVECKVGNTHLIVLIRMTQPSLLANYTRV